MIRNTILFCGIIVILIAAKANALELYQPPEPLQWKMEPHSKVSDEVTMAVVPLKNKDKVEYRFECTAGDAASSKWQESNTYTVSGLKPEREYTFVAHARSDGKGIGLPSKKISVKTRNAEGDRNTAMIDDALRKGRIECIPIMINGDKDNRVNIVLANRWEKGHRNAYNKPQMREEFVKDCRHVLKAFTNGDSEVKHPYPEYKSFINFYGMWWPEVPPTPTGKKKGKGIIFTRRGYQKIRDRHFLPWSRPGRGWVTQLVMPNSDNGGGNAGRKPDLRIGDAWIAGNSVNGTIHEFSHTAPGCPDEYTSSGMWGFGNEGSTTTSEHRRNFCRWRKWIDKDTPVPTPYSRKYLGKTGLHEGGVHRMAHHYRPWARGCIMGSGSGGGPPPKELCVVCKQRTVMRFYQWVDAIDERSPALDEITIPKPCRMKFSVKRVHPEPDTQKTAWKLNGKTIAENTDSIEVEFTNLKKYELEFSLVDESKYIRPDPPYAEYPLAHTKWTILNPKATGSSDQMKVTINAIKPVFKGIDNGIIKVSAKGGKAPYNFIWSDGGEGAERKSFAPGNYSVDVVDSEFRNISQNIDLQPSKLINPRIVSDYDGKSWQVKCPAAEKGLVTVKWNTCETSAEIKGKSEGEITCELLAPNGCITTQKLNLKRPGKLLQIKPAKVYASSGGENNGYVELQVVGGRKPMRFFWSDGIKTDTPERYYLCPGRQSVTVRDANGTERICQFNIGSEPAFFVKGLRLKRQGDDRVCITNPDKEMGYLWFKKDIPGWLPRFPHGIYSGIFTSADGKTCDVEAYVIQNKGGYYIKPDEKKRSFHHNDLGHWAHVMIWENGHKKDPRILKLKMTVGKNGIITLSNGNRKSDEEWTGTVIDGRMTGKRTDKADGSFEMHYISRPELIDKPFAVGTSCVIPKPGNYFIAARKKSNGAISHNRFGVAFGSKPENMTDPIDPKNVTSAKMLMWLDASDLNANGKPDDGSEIPLRRGAMVKWQGKANDVNLGGFVFYLPNKLNGLGVASWKTIWKQWFKKRPKGYQTIIMVRREHDLSSVGTAPWEGLKPLIGVGEYGKKLFCDEAAKTLENSSVFVNGEKVDPKRAKMPQDFYIATYEFDKKKNNENKLAGTDGHWEGIVAECLIFDGKLSDQERRSIEEYLRRKWLSAIDLQFDKRKD